MSKRAMIWMTVAGLLIALTGTAASVASAATITWGPAISVAAPTDVVTTGQLVEADDIGSAVATSVNGVTFAAAGPAGWGNTNFAAYGTAGMAGTYGAALTTGTFTDGNGSTGSHIYTGLTIGNNYLLQVWFVDTRFGGGTGTNQLLDGVAPNLSGTGQYAIGTFTADATTQAFTWTENGPQFNGATLNLAQLRDVTPIPATAPEPSALSLAMLGLVGLVAGRRRRRRA